MRFHAETCALLHTDTGQKKHVKTQHVTNSVPHYKNKSNVLILWIIIRFFLIISAGTPPNPNVMNVP